MTKKYVYVRKEIHSTEPLTAEGQDAAFRASEKAEKVADETFDTIFKYLENTFDSLAKLFRI